MSQTLIHPKRSRGIFQDVILVEHKRYLLSSANLTSCIVCNRSLEDGYSLTAKHTSSGTLFFCEKHY